MKRTLSAHGRAVVLCTWLAALSYCLPAAAQALTSAPRLADGLKSYDFEFIAWCVLVATVGGFGRTVLTLLTPQTVVLSVLHEAWKDVLISALAGVVAAVALYAAHSLGATIPVPVDVLLVAACGWARTGFFVWAGNSTRTLADRMTQWAGDKIAKPDPLAATARQPDAIPARVDVPDEQP